MNFNWKIITGSVLVVLILIGGVWFFISRPSATPTSTSNNSFGTATDNTTTTNTNTSSNTPQPIVSTQQNPQQKIFQIAQVPVVGATLIQTLHPTTTIARYIEQDNGHVFDIALDVAGSVPRIVSNVTIPGGQRAIWVEGGNSAIVQYIDSDNITVKSVYLGFPTATTSSGTLPTRIQFLPDNIIDIAASPDGKSVAYLLKTKSGADGYIAKADGTAAKKLFSLPLSQILISWPSLSMLLVQTNSAAGVAGIIFSIDAKSGLVTPLVYAKNITAIADVTFTHIIYQTIQDGAAALSTYSHDVKNNLDTKLSFNPLPEKCIWSKTATNVLFCAVPSQSTPTNYLDLWHQGTASVGDNIFIFNINTNQNLLVATPYLNNTVSTDIAEMSLSPDEHYLSFTTKADRSLWGVRLTQ